MPSAAEKMVRRIPFVPSLQAMECGPACLTMVLGAHGCHVPLTEVRDLCGVGRSGVTGEDLVLAARSFGLEADGLGPLEPEELPVLLADGPAILHWDMRHMVVAVAADARGVIILDPASGRRRVDPNEVRRRFTGVAIRIVPGPGLKPRSPRSGAIRAYFGRLQKDRVTVLLTVWAGVLAQIATVLPALGTQAVVDSLQWSTLASAGAFLGILALLGVQGAWIQGLQSRLAAKLAARADLGMMSAVLQRMGELPLAWAQARGSSELLLRLNLARGLLGGLANISATAVTQGGVLLASTAALTILHPLLLLVSALVAGLGLAVSLWAARRLVDYLHGPNVRAGRLAHAAVETAGAMEWIELAGLRGWVQAGMCRLGERWGSVRTIMAEQEARLTLLQTWVRATGDVATLGVAVWLANAGRLTLGQFGAFLILADLFRGATEGLGGLPRALSDLRVGIDRTEDVLAAEPEAHGTHCGQIRGDIRLEDVEFRYFAGAPSVFEGINLSIRAGEMVALVGPSGAGKSTFAALLGGMRQPSQGRVLLDGVPLEEWEESSLRSQVGFALQRPETFSGTIRWNLAFGAPTTDTDLWEALRFACLDAKVVSMGGLDALVDFEGANLSGGERQRLALARVMLTKPRILILDEATSALDLGVERAIHGHLRALLTTRILITHREASLELADRRLLLEGGRLHG